VSDKTNETLVELLSRPDGIEAAGQYLKVLLEMTIRDTVGQYNHQADMEFEYKRKAFLQVLREAGKQIDTLLVACLEIYPEPKGPPHVSEPTN